MCGRSSLTKTEKELEERFKAAFYSEDLERYNPIPNFNIAPTQMVPVVTQDDPEHISIYRWGLIPFWAKDIKIGSKMINARIESILDKPSFKQAVEKRRCLVPTDGYYEWLKEGSGKIPYRIKRKDDDIFSMAGLYEKWRAGDGLTIHSFTIITREADPTISMIHDRMPFMLDKENEKTWIDPTLSGPDLVHNLPVLSIDELTWYPVSDRVNKVTENDPGLIEPRQ